MSLSQSEAFDLQFQILNNQISTEKLIEVFQEFSTREITSEEFLGFLQASKQMQVELKLDFDTLDVCGTGGDGLNTFNISTLTAIVCSSGGAKVAKHGNRSSGGKCGGADILEVLGVRVDLKPEQSRDLLEKTGFCFLFAPIYNPAFRFAKEARVSFGKPTYFNFLGPLLNPTKPSYQLLGLNDFSKADLIAKLLQANNSKSAWVLKSAEGMDELSPCSQNQVLQVGSNSTKLAVINPKIFGFQGNFENLIGSNTQINLEIAQNVLANTAKKEQFEAVCLNAGAGFTVCGISQTLEEGILLAKELIKSGKSRAKLYEIINQSKKYD